MKKKLFVARRTNFESGERVRMAQMYENCMFISDLVPLFILIMMDFLALQITQNL